MNHVWVGDPYGDGYCCASKSESQACCEADSGKWCDGTCCPSNQECGDGGVCVSTSCEDIETSGSGTSCGEYITIAQFYAQTAGKVKLTIGRDPSQCGSNCHIFSLMDDWAQSSSMGCEESSHSKTFSYSAGTHIIQLVVNDNCATECSSFTYTLTCE